MIDKYDIGATTGCIAAWIFTSLDEVEQGVRIAGGIAFLIFTIISIYYKYKKNKK